MVKTCCVKNCEIAPKGDVTCFRFPNNRFLKRKWIDAIGLSNKLTANSTVCIKHFQQDDYDIVRGRPRLKAKVIPSVFCKSDTKSYSPCVTDAESISNEITLRSSQKRNLDLVEGNKDSRNEAKKELHNVANTKSQSDEGKSSESRVEIQNEGRSGSQIEINIRVQNDTCLHLQNSDITALNAESRTKSHNDHRMAIHKEGTTELQSEDTTESQNIASEDAGNESRVELDRNDETQPGGVTEDSNDNVDGEKRSQKTKPNGVILKEKKNGKGYQDSFIESTTKPRSSAEDLNKDIEDIIVNYQIKQTRPVHVAGERPQTPGAVEDCPQSESDPVFIELAVQGDRAGSPRDCLMVLESVQVELDPSSFLADGDPDECTETVDLVADDDDPSPGPGQDSRPDPISLLTSSDEDEVIIQEPHIDTVEVSDETDEDDVPLVKLLDKPKPKKKRKSKISIWNAYEYFCMDCQYTANSRQEYRAHAAAHSTILQVCEICDYTTASKTQFSRHKRKHKDDKKFKCHLCDYKARHNMSLIYHLKSHRALSSAQRGYKCDKCGFKSDVKTALLKHVKLCTTDVKKYSCGKCVYETKRPSDLRRHCARRHQEQLDDDEEFVP